MARAWRAMSIAAIIAVFMAISGAFGSSAAPMPARLAYWLTTMLASSAIGVGLFILAGRRGWLIERPIAFSAILALSMAAPITGVVWLTTGLFFPHFSPFTATNLVLAFPPVLLVCLLMTALNVLASGGPVRTHAAAKGAAPPRFLQRLPPRLRGAELYAVQSEDHYLRLHTSLGSDLILLRLADAVAELEGIEGAQTHRSWWVAKSAVTDARRADGRALLTLRNGVEAPVSRGYAAALRQAGWF